MELRQLRYFARVVELGSFSRAAAELGVVPSALSQQISRLEGELATRLLQRTSTGVQPTEAGLAFWRQAQLVLRHAEGAVQAAQQARLSGRVSVGLAPTTATLLGLPLMLALRERYPEVRLHLVESLSGDLAAMLGARQLDLAVLFRADAAPRCSAQPLLEEPLFAIGARSLPGLPQGKSTRMAALAGVPLLLPSATHDLRTHVQAAFARAKCVPNVAFEIDGLALLMAAVAAGCGATVQPASALARLPADDLAVLRITDRHALRPNFLVSLPDDELAPAALAARVTLVQVARELVAQGRWPGARLHED